MYKRKECRKNPRRSPSQHNSWGRVEAFPHFSGVSDHACKKHGNLRATKSDHRSACLMVVLNTTMVLTNLSCRQHRRARSALYMPAVAFQREGRVIGERKVCRKKTRLIWTLRKDTATNPLSRSSTRPCSLMSRWLKSNAGEWSRKMKIWKNN